MYFLNATLILKSNIETKSPADWYWMEIKNDMNKNITNKDIIDGSFIIPEGVTEIGDYAFYECSSLKKVSLPKKVKLGHSVFHGCPPDLEIEYRD